MTIPVAASNSNMDCHCTCRSCAIPKHCDAQIQSVWKAKTVIIRTEPMLDSLKFSTVVLYQRTYERVHLRCSCVRLVCQPQHSSFTKAKMQCTAQTAGPAQQFVTACTAQQAQHSMLSQHAQHIRRKHSNLAQHAQHQFKIPHLDSECPGILTAAGQEDVAPSEVAMKHIQTMKVCQGSSNLLSCQKDAA